MDVLSADFQADLLAVMLQDTSFLSKHRDIIDGDLFKDHAESDIANIVLSFFDKYGSTPAKNTFYQFMDMSGFDVTSSSNIVDEYYSRRVTDIAFIEESLRSFVRGSRLRDAMREGVSFLEKGMYDELVNTINKASVSVNDADVGNKLWSDRKKVLRNLGLSEPYVPTGLTSLDSRMSGGAARGTLNVVITPPNRGKSTALINIGKYAAISGFRVVHYTFELSAAVIERRYFMSMVRMSKAEMLEKQKTAYNRIMEYADRITDESVIIKWYPAHTATTNTMRGHLHGIKNRLGFFPDVIVVDYADLMRAAQHYEQKRHELAAIYYDLRNVAQEMNAALWTASQTNRGGTDGDLITQEDLAECYEKAAAADVMISINQTLDERRAHPQTARIFIAKNRDDESQVVDEIQTDWGRAWIGDL